MEKAAVLQKVRENWKQLENASAALQDDREIVLEAVKEDGGLR